ncbi:hypothetical protein [Rhizobium terrae]|uniref:hypothetical protein n=1 Tax=Rhizobium terrae TaxID=2171756 RepID=UPI0013C318C2|nr:hypothetical protein [Rhizobium terrae]
MTRKVHILALIAGLRLASPIVAVADEVPKFMQFAEKVYVGPRAPARLATKDEQAFATRLREGAKRPVNFAGHYILATWGCGAECLGGAVIDARSGAVTWLPYSICCWGEGEPFYYRKDSRLIVFSGVLNEESQKGAHFFEFRNGSFHHLTSRAKDGSALPVPPAAGR